MTKTKLKKILIVNSWIMLVVLMVNWHTTLLINESPSVSGKIFLLVKTKNFQKGDLIGIKCFHSDYTKERHFTKRLVGVPGDLIAVKDRKIYINGMCKGVAKSHTKDLRPLTPIAPQIIPDNKYFVMTEHKDSFDSRYVEFGLVGEQHIEGKVYHIW